MEMSEVFTNSALWLIFTLFNIYSTIATVILRIFLPVTKYFVEKRFRNFGFEINGKHPWDVKVLNEKRFYPRVAVEGTLALLEGVVDGDCEVKDLRTTIKLYFDSRRQSEGQHPLTWVLKSFNLQTKARAWQVGEEHYDVGNDIIKAMLDKNLQYTCGYWKNAINLDDAQFAKMELIANKLKLKPGMRVLDIGCGFGTLAYHLAKNYGVSVVGCTVSKESIKYGAELCKGLPCDFVICDYRDINEKFDRVVSIGMFEHVGRKNLRTFFEVCHRCLKDDGILLLHTIGMSHIQLIGCDSWIHKYIFPNGYVPHFVEVCKAFEGLWIMEDWHNFGLDYTKTLAAWEHNFDNAWPALQYKYGERFHRIWKTYLQSSYGIFASRGLQLWQIVLSKDGLKDGYYSPR